MKSRHNHDGHGKRRATVASMVAFTVQSKDMVQFIGDQRENVALINTVCEE
jgi:hypothetical protein